MKPPQIFADIRRVLGVEVVNLIWRHLATIPERSALGWEMLRPLYADGTIAPRRRRLRDDLDLPRLPPFPAEALPAAGLLDGDVSAIRTYSCRIQQNQRDGAHCAVGSVVRLDNAASTPARGIILWRSHLCAQRRADPAATLPSMAELPPATAELVWTLNRLGT